MRLFVKAIRAQQLYAANNPMHKAALDALRAGFGAVWSVEPDTLVLNIGETEIQWSGVTVLAEGPKSSDNLAWLFYKDGIRELRFQNGIEDAEIIRFIDIICRARKAGVEDDDLITMLWEADLTGLAYHYLDVNADEVDGDGVRDGRPAPTEMSPEELHLQIEQAHDQAKMRRSGVVNMADFDQTLYFLDEKEVDYLKQEIAREYEQDLRLNIVAALLDVFEQQANDAIREEALDHVETMLAFLLAAGNFRGVAYLLAETRVAAHRPTDLTPNILARVGSIADRLSAPATVAQMLESLDTATTLPPRQELELLFDQLKGTALGPVFTWLPRVKDERLRDLVVGVANRLASVNSAELVKLIDSSDPVVSNEAMKRAAGLGAQAAVGPIARIMSDPDPKRRQLAAQSLSEIGSTGALAAMEKALTDTDREVRILAMRALAAGGAKSALSRLETIVRSKEIRDADITEKTAAFESYGALCGDRGVENLDAILNGKAGFLGKREDTSIRAAAAVALSRIRSSRAMEALQKASADKEPVVRNAVSRAIKVLSS
jgi:HEAT repeat protein